MKVKCIKIYNVHTKKYVLKDYWMTIGKEYLVLAIEVRENRTSYVVASDSNQQPILQNAMQFEIVSGKIPKNWHAIKGEFDLFSIGPKSWQERGFLEDCYDHEPYALEIYKREVRIMMEEEDAIS